MKKTLLKHSKNEVFIEIIKKSKSFSEVYRLFGLKPRGGIHNEIIKKRIEELKLDISHFDPYFDNKNNKGKSHSLENILIINSNYSSSNLKKRLIRDGILINKCILCDIGPFWNNKDLILQLDHINGVHTDNRIENLRILCPNCHTQTPTYAGRKAKKYYFCMDCGKDITRVSKRCMNCESISERRIKVRISSRKVKNRPLREILIKQVEELGFVATGKSYGVSDNCIRKWLGIK